jgi:hypothetical protein
LTPVFMFWVPVVISRGTEGVGSCFDLTDSFSAVRRVSVPVFMFYTPRLIFGGTEGIGSQFHVLRSWAHFRRYRGRQARFHVLRSRTHFRRYGGRQVSFSCFAQPDSFSAVPRASGPAFMFCAPELVFGGPEDVRSLCDPFSRTPHRRLVAMGCRRRGRRSLLSVHFWC